MTAHCRDPQSCSICLQTPARRVEIVNGRTLVDGVPVVSDGARVGGSQTAIAMPQPRSTKHRYGRRRK